MRELEDLENQFGEALADVFPPTLRDDLATLMNNTIDGSDCFKDKDEAKKNAEESLRDFLIEGDDDKNNKRRKVAQLYGILHRESDQDKCNDSIPIQGLENTLKTAYHGLADVGTELYVLDMTYDLVFLSLILLAVGMLYPTIVNVFSGKDRREGWLETELLHWGYTACNLISIFASIMAFTLCITREFWIRPWTKIGMLDQSFGVTNDNTVDFADDIPHDYWSASLHTRLYGSVIACFVLQMLYLAAHFALQYGPMSRYVETVLEEGKAAFTGSKAGSKAATPAAMTAMRVKYSPLISVVH